MVRTAVVVVSVCMPLRLRGGREREEEKVGSVTTSEFLVLYVFCGRVSFTPISKRCNSGGLILEPSFNESSPQRQRGVTRI